MSGLVIVDYDAGNIGSVANICKRAGGKAEISADPERIAAAGKLILPGVGHFGRAMARLNDSGIRAALDAAKERGAPILGICLGMQLLTMHSEEGDADGLGWIDAHAKRFDLPAPLKVPHMGWNDVAFTRPDVLTEGLEGEARFYFVHSYVVQADDESAVLGRTDYGGPFVSVVQKDNVWGFQCHPEKSHKYGLTVIRNFVDKVPGL
ncbi:imidazole glycerol phosphate synthase subunit HisH [Sphingomonas sp. G-3-2-10]|uniref:imidazole glycerol phosphate synthase subunit HisH n=1 Tax=Sphingomonas sp. G-3-2-10 TaxID=2728838 RepID=UPI00146C5D46|nr:imidazole glycerol phosphate synthase subunit HisH [Sphingomonas sp. G-3-2-10]NML06233.1 imidazole glycerol phosphate synthase subunit HisH [Sphingomonas sp. G-3-2-10]